MKVTPSLRDQLRAQLADLKMPGALEALDEILSGLDGGTLKASAALTALLAAQIALRNHRRLDAAMRSSRLPAVKTLADFDFSFQPSVKREQMESLHTLGFLERKENVVFLGPTGTGKTWLACALGQSACRQGHTVRYVRLPRLLSDELVLARADGSYGKLMQTMAKTDLLILDDWGLAPLGDRERRDLLELIEERAGRRATLVTSQLPIEHWHEMIGDATFGDAILDRLVHHAHRLTLTGGSLRRLAPTTKSPASQAD